MKCADPHRNLIWCESGSWIRRSTSFLLFLHFTLKPGSGSKGSGRCEIEREGEIMRILTLTVILGLPLMALGQREEPQQSPAQSNETQTTEPAKGKQKSQLKSETDTNVRGQTNVQGRAQDVNKNEARSSTSQKTTVNKQEFRSRHAEVFNLGRHPKEFFIQRFGANHFRLIGNTYFVFVDSCWVAVDVDGFVYTERMICPGDPDFIEVDVD